MSTREENIYLAKLTEQTERFEDMVQHMKKVAEINQPLSNEERNLLSVAYKNSVGTRRSAWRALSSILQKEEAKGSKNLRLIKDLKAKIESEMNDICNDILKLLDEHVIPNATDAEPKVFFYKMKGDYYRYISEYATGDYHKEVADKALKAYNDATEIADKSLKTTHPIRLGLALNFSVFYYEVINDPQKACSKAKKAFDDAIGDIDQLDEDQYKDSTTIMQLIRDNLTLWTSELQDEADGTNVENL